MKGFLAFFAATIALIGSLFGAHPATSTSPAQVTSTTAPIAAVAPAPADASACQGLLNQKLVQCYTQVAVSNKDLSGCDKITDNFMRAECYSEVAVARQDTAGCYRASYQIGIQESCFDQIAAIKNDLAICSSKQAISDFYISSAQSRTECYAAVAAARKDASLCASIPSSDPNYASCYVQVASSTQDATVCNALTDPSSQTFCKQKAIPPTVDACNKYTGAQKDYCLYELVGATTIPDASLCGQISSTQIASTCYAGVAAATKDPAICTKVTDPAGKDKCYALAATQMQDSSVCKNIASSTAQSACVTASNPPTAASCAALPPLTAKTSIANSSAECYINLAQYYYSDSYCTSIPAGYARDDCYNQASYKTSDPATCDKISAADSTSKDQCYQIVGETLNDPNICLKIKDGPQQNFRSQCLDVVEAATRSSSTCAMLSGADRDECYSNVAFEVGDVSLCQNVVSTTPPAMPNTRWSCIRNVAIVKNDFSLCPGIPAGAERDECYYQVGWLDANSAACGNIAQVSAPNSYTSYPPSQQACYAAAAKK